MIDMTELHKEQKVDEVNAGGEPETTTPTSRRSESKLIYQNLFVNSVVRPGGSVHREAAPEAGVAVVALHPGEAGAGTATTSLRSSRPLRVRIPPGCFSPVSHPGAAQRARRQKPGQRRPVLGPAGGLPGLGSEPARKHSPRSDYILRRWGNLRLFLFSPP